MTFDGTEKMNLDMRALGAVGESLDQHNVPLEDRQLQFVIDGVKFCLNAEGCWRLNESDSELGWIKCTLPHAVAPMS